jgi:hypothetical protein
VEGFAEVVNKTWDLEVNSSNDIEIWQTRIKLLRKGIKGWSRNIGDELKKEEN